MSFPPLLVHVSGYIVHDSSVSVTQVRKNDINIVLFFHLPEKNAYYASA